MTAGNSVASTRSVISAAGDGFSDTCEETHAQAWQRLFVGPWALRLRRGDRSGWIANLCCLAIQIGTSSVDARERHSVRNEAKRPEDNFGSLLLMAAWLAENGPRQNAKNCWHGTFFRGQHVF